MRRLLPLWTLLLALACPPAGATPPLSDPDHVILVMLRTAPAHFRPDQAYGGGYGDTLDASARLRKARSLARRHGLTLLDNWPMPTLEIDCFVMRIPASRTAEDVAKEVARDAGVAWSQPLHRFHTESLPYDDPLYAAQPAARAWHLAELHRVATGKGVTVAVLDSGIDAHHPDLVGRVSLARDFTGRPEPAPERHGTSVAGVIAARGDNHAGIVGVAPNAQLLALRACWQETGGTVCDSFSLAKALQFAVTRDAPIINLSLSGPYDPLLERLIAVGLARGQTVVAAVDPVAQDGGFPAALPGVIAVSDRRRPDLRIATFVAPGRDIPTTEPGGKWSVVNGSSYAAAHISGLLALVREGKADGPPVLLPAAQAGAPVNACLTLTRARNAHECLCTSGC